MADHQNTTENNNNGNSIGNNKKMSMLDFVEFLSSDSESESEIKPSSDENNVEVDDETEDEDEDDNENENETVLNAEQSKQVNKDGRKSTEKKKETLALIHQFHTHIVSLEKERKALLHRKNRPDGRVYNELEEVEQKYNEDRSKEKVKIQEDLNKISSKVEKFKREKTEIKKCATYLEKLKLLMEDIEENIMQFKEKQRIVYEDLMADGKTLASEIEAFENKINLWSQPPKPKALKNSSEKSNIQAQLPREVEEFENFLKLTGGHQGGWDDIDHQTFLKLRKQFKKDGQLLNAAIRDIPTQNDEDIQQHIEWYEEYYILRERNRETIRLWKNLKQNERDDMLRNAEVDQEIEEKKRKKKEEQLEREREERFQQLKEYKEHRHFEETREKNMKEELDIQKKEKLKIDHMLDEKRRLELKLEVEDYRLKKKEEQEILKQAQEEKIMKEKQMVSEEEKNRIKERNDRLILSKMQQKLSREQELQEKEKRLEKLKQQVAVNVERDPNRLFKLTTGWERRKEDSGSNSKTNSVVTGARLMPHRAVPSWRGGMNG